jgi:hypothetical protein
MRLERTDGPPLQGRLRYIEPDLSFRFDPASPEAAVERAGREGESSLALATVQLHFGVETGLVLYPDGYSPRQGWRASALGAPPASAGQVRVTLDEDAVPGIGYRPEGLRTVEVSHDREAGWVRLAGGAPPSPGADYVEVAPGVVLELESGRLLALWLRPEPADQAPEA